MSGYIKGSGAPATAAAPERKVKRRKRRPCGNPPAVPTGVVLSFTATEALTHLRFTGKVKWDRVTTDEQGHGTRIKDYEVLYRAVNAAGVPQELEDGKERRRVVRRMGAGEIRLDAATNPTGTTFRFTTRKDHGISTGDKVIVADCSHPGTYNGSWVVTAAPSSTTFEVASGGPTGVADCDDPGKVIDDQDGTLVILRTVPRPKTWYWQAKVRAVDFDDCAGSWSAWTAPVLPWTGADPRPPAPTFTDPGAVTFDRIGRDRHVKLRLLFTFDEVPYWDVPGGDREDDVAGYGVQLDRSDDGITWDGSPYRHHYVPSRDAGSSDADDTALTRTVHFIGIRRRYWYRVRIRTVDRYGRKGDWSAWTTPALPFDDTQPPRPENVRWLKHRDRLVVKWTVPVIYIDTRGSVTASSGASTLAGTGTKFTVEVEAGTTIKVGAETKVVKRVTSDTALTIVGTWASLHTDARLKLEEPDPDVAQWEWQVAKSTDVDLGTTPDDWSAIYDSGRVGGRHNMKAIRVEDDDEDLVFYVRVRSIDAAKNRSRWIPGAVSGNSDPDANGDGLGILRDIIVVAWTVPGDVAVGYYDQLWRAHKDFRIKRATGNVGRHNAATHPDDGTPGGQALQVNFRRISSDQTTNVPGFASPDIAILDTDSRLEIGAGSHKDTASGAGGEFNTNEILAGEFVALKISQIGTTRPGKHLVASLVLIPK